MMPRVAGSGRIVWIISHCQRVEFGECLEPMKVHRVLAEAAFGLLEAVFVRGRVLDHAMSKAFVENPKWGKRDRAFVAETVFEVVRWRRALAFVAAEQSLPRLCAAQWLRMGVPLPDWLGVSAAQARDMEAREVALAGQSRAVRESVPDWLDELGERELGGAWAGELAALNRRAPVYLRVNALKSSREEARGWLATLGVECAPVEGLADALVVPQGRSVPKAVLGDGRVEIQDAGSQQVVPWLNPQPGETVIDACAGAGGKTLHMAAWMGNRGSILAMDVSGAKLEGLRQRGKRAGAAIIRTRVVDEALAADLPTGVDRVLIDAPCSGLGTLRRQPDLKWRLTLQKLERIRRLQRALVPRYGGMVRPGGLVLYATCSVLPSENRGAVEELLALGEFRLVGEWLVSPASSGFDGFYGALLQRE